MKVKILFQNKIQEIECNKGENLLSLLQCLGYPVTARCGGNGKCGKCKVAVLEGDFPEMRDGYVLACRTLVNGDCTVRLSDTEGSGLTEAGESEAATDGEEGYGVALDVGTTTLAFALCDLKTGKTLEKVGVLNRQDRYGADVISRILSAEQGNAEALQESVLSQTREVLRGFFEQYGFSRLKRLVVSGNTTMLHFFLGKDATGIGRYPFRAAFLSSVTTAGETLGLDVDEVVLLPSVAAYLGADIVAGGLYTDIGGGARLLVDIGTNGEMLLHTAAGYLSTSTAAGPCFEGANIECGTGGVKGAIDSVKEENGKLVYTVIGGGEGTALCGAGLVDAVALLLDKGVVDETGAFTDGTERFHLNQKVYVSQGDVRNFQLAKSAICAGIRVLLQTAGVTPQTLERLFVAGGLGFYLNLKNAFRVGLLPKELEGKITVAGNTSLAGAKLCLLSQEARNRCEELARSAEYLDLSAHPAFMEEYVENMSFGD